MQTLSDAIEDHADVSTKGQKLGKFMDLLDRSGIQVDDIGRINRMNAWQGFYKDKEGVEHKVDMVGVQLVPNWADGPLWPVIQQAKPCVVRPLRVAKPSHSDFKTACILPDIQFGFRMLPDGLDPFHDELALSAALAVVRVTKPDLIVLLGDTGDFPGQSKYIQDPTWALTGQAAIDRIHRFLAELRSAAPEARIVVLEGNHDLRLTRHIQVNAAASFRLQVANIPTSWPVLTLPFLCRFDELNIEYVSGYPAGEVWINDNLRCIHGLKVKSAGSTASIVADDERVSTIFGHIHRIELQHRTRQVRSGPRFSLAASPGCLCRLDGAVPSVKGGVDLLGRPLVSYENWQNGMAVVTYKEGDGPDRKSVV